MLAFSFDATEGSLSALLLPAALFWYFVGVFLVVVGTVNRAETLKTSSTFALTIAWACHIAAIVQHGREVGHFPLSNNIEYLLVLGWVVLTLYLLVWLRFKVIAAGFVLPPLAAFMSVPALWLPTRHGEAPYPGKQLLFVFHTTVATLGMAALCVAFAMSLIFLLQDRAIKSKRTPRLLSRLPSLNSSERIGHVAILWGFPMLTLGIATGSLWSLDTYGSVWVGGAKQTFPILAWIVFAIVLYGRLARGFGGRKSAYLTIAGFALGLLTVLGMSF